jgi:hypothetical protein
MRQSLFILAITLVFYACGSKEDKATPAKLIIKDTASNFFRVTSFLKGQIFEIKNGGTTPFRKITSNNKTDSSWVKMESLDSLFVEFLNPVIDSTNLKESFVEKRFLDQTVNAFTFSYDPINIAKNDFAFKRWDVYVDPDNEKVKRIYLIKKANENTQLLLTWQADKWCKIVTLNTTNNKTAVSKEETITWKYE